MRNTIYRLVEDIEPFDRLEELHKNEVLKWIEEGHPLFRISKPDNPPKHLATYFVLYDRDNLSLLLIDHIKSGLRLPSGGHVDLDEDPKETTIREANEELKIAAEFTEEFGENPLLITSTITNGHDKHVDVTFWYIIKGDKTQTLDFDKREMTGYSWMTPDEILAMDSKNTDPHMHRFVQKMTATLAK